MDWDLASGHSRAKLGWQGNNPEDGREINDVKSLRIGLPGGMVVDEREDIEQVIVDLEKDTVVDVVVYFPNETVERAVERARAMAGRYGLDDQGTFEKLLQDVAVLRSKKLDEGSGPSAGAGYPKNRTIGPDDPTLEVRVLPGPDLDRRWYVQLRVDWTTGESYDWDLSKTHTVADVGGGFPADGSAEAYVPNVVHLGMALPGNKAFRVDDRAGEVRMTRSGDVITRLQATFGEPGQVVDFVLTWGV